MPFDRVWGNCHLSGNRIVISQGIALAINCQGKGLVVFYRVFGYHLSGYMVFICQDISLVVIYQCIELGIICQNLVHHL